MKRRSVLPLVYGMRLKSAEAWLALGHLDEAVEEWKKLPQNVRLHPEARPVREKLFQLWRVFQFVGT